MLVHQPHIAARGEPAVMIEGEVLVFYDPRAGGWSLHVDDNALDVSAKHCDRATNSTRLATSENAH